MRHLFVESNWVYASCAPEHLREPAAVLLLQKARNGELLLHLPALCLREGADAVRKKCQPRIPEEMRKFLRAARLGDKLSVEHSEIVTQALEPRGKPKPQPGILYSRWTSPTLDQGASQVGTPRVTL